MMTRGAGWCVERGCGWHRDLGRMEEGSCIAGTDPSVVTDHAIQRGINQLGPWDLAITTSKFRSSRTSGYVIRSRLLPRVSRATNKSS